MLTAVGPDCGRRPPGFRPLGAGARLGSVATGVREARRNDRQKERQPMFVLKMRHTKITRKGDNVLADTIESSDWFIEADRVIVSARFAGREDRDRVSLSWQESGTLLEDLSSWTAIERKSGDTEMIIHGGALLSATRAGETTWYLASSAWLMGPDGRTIERLT